MAYQYANDQQDFHRNFITAWQKMMTVPGDQAETLTEITYGLRCVGRRPRCVGDIYRQRCRDFPIPQC